MASVTTSKIVIKKLVLTTRRCKLWIYEDEDSSVHSFADQSNRG